MKFSVLIPTYRRAEDLPRLFDSLSKQIVKPEKIFAIVGPNDVESRQIVNSWKESMENLYLLQGQKESVIHSINLGLAAIQEDIIGLLDDDVWLPPDWAAKIVIAFRSDKKLGAFGGRDFLQNGAPELTDPPLSKIIGTFTWNGHKGYHHCGSVTSPVKIDVIKGVNLSFRKKAFSAMQIDPILEGRGAETCWEMDLCLSIKKKGYDVVYDNNNYVLHYWSPRLGFDNRTDAFSPAWSKRIFNEAFIFGKYRSFAELSIWGLRLFFIGTRVQPGIVWTLLLIWKRGWHILKIPWRNLIYLYKGMQTGLSQRN